jgi:NAD(P)-dependent dehydrogenase (short-subunit alcohol dehydrogenase family)
VSEQRWTPADLPDLSGHTVVVTGANSGLGYETSLELARHGAHVVLASRDEAKGQEALTRLRAAAPRASAELRLLDLADLASVRAFAAGLAAETVDILVNNAGVMAVPRRSTADGFELQLGTNHLGHFALTGLLLANLLRGNVRGGPARVVTVSSGLHRSGRLHRDDLMGERSYSPWGAYAQSKLANLLFMNELARRAQVARVRLASLAAHPGYASTNLQSVGPQMRGNRLIGGAMRIANAVFAQPASHGAWPSLRAAGDPNAAGGDYFGPGGFAEQRGSPRLVAMTAHALDPDDAAWLWERSVELTGVDYAGLVRTPR